MQTNVLWPVESLLCHLLWCWKSSTQGKQKYFCSSKPRSGSGSALPTGCGALPASEGARLGAASAEPSSCRCRRALVPLAAALGCLKSWKENMFWAPYVYRKFFKYRDFCGILTLLLTESPNTDWPMACWRKKKKTSKISKSLMPALWNEICWMLTLNIN